MSADVSVGDLARLARAGDPVAFRLLVERHQSMVRARARQLATDPGDVDDIVQESFLQAFLALDRLRDPDRFAGWLAGIVLNVCRSLHRRAPVTLLADWPEPLHPTSAGGLPSAEDLDRADALRAAVAELPAGQRRAVTLHYYADVPAGQVAKEPGAARASLHKARLRLRAYLTEHRPDLVPVSGRTHMTTVRVARIERRIPPGPVPDRFPTHVMVLADEAGRRDLPIWLLGQDSHRFADDARPGPGPDELTDRLLRVAGTRVTAVDVDELGPEVTVARIELATPVGPGHVTARLLDGLAMAITAGAPIRVANAVMDRLAAPAGPARPPGARADRPGPECRPTTAVRTAQPDLRRRPGPLGARRQLHRERRAVPLAGLLRRRRPGDRGALRGCAAAQGFAWLAQEIFADDYRGAAVTFRGQFRTPEGTGLAGLFLRVMKPRDLHGPFTAQAALADPANHFVTLEGPGDWTIREVTAPIPDDANTVAFGLFLNGPGRIELRDPEFTARR